MSKVSLFDIEQQYLQLAEQLMESGGEATPEMEQALAMNKEELQNKAVNYAMVCKQLEGECKIGAEAIETLKGKIKAREKAIERLKINLAAAMKLYEIPKIETPLMKIYLQKSETCEIDDLAAIPKKFITVKIVDPVSSPDKKAIKEAIKAGEEVPGAYIQEHQNLQIK